MKELEGIFIPMGTPFRNQEIALEQLKENVEKLNQTGISGYMPLGTNGEFKSLSDEESLEVIETVNKARSEEKILMAGTGRESVKETIKFTEKAAEKGIDYAVVLTPHYFARLLTEKALIEFFTEVAAASPVPVLLYSAPGYASGVKVTKNVVKEVAEHPNIAGMKDTTPSDMINYLIAARDTDNFKVLAGSISNLYTGVTLGAAGGTISMANYLPDLCAKLFNLIRDKNNKVTRELYLELYNLNKAISSRYGVAGVKTAMDIMGYNGGSPRKPVKKLEENAVKEIETKLKQTLKIVEEYI
ncbi:MAG: dihydrodipicolinate synthase family protein [Halanaerobiaceae bacterium]